MDLLKKVGKNERETVYNTRYSAWLCFVFHAGFYL